MARGSLVAGARIRVRDAEWVVGHVERNPVSGRIIHATGLSGIVRDKPAIFVQSVEGQRGRGIEVVDPADVELVADSSGGYEDTLLHLEAAFRKSAPTGPAPQVAGKAAIDDLDFQLDPVRLALRRRGYESSSATMSASARRWRRACSPRNSSCGAAPSASSSSRPRRC